MGDDEPRTADERGTEGRSGQRFRAGPFSDGEHPPPLRLLEYHERRLPPAVADAVQEHLLVCEECSTAVLDLAAFPSLDPPSEDHRLSGADVEERWCSLEWEVGRRSRPFWERREVLIPVVAVLVAAAVGLGLWVTKLGVELDALHQPRGDLEVVADLLPVDRLTRGASLVVQPSPAAGRLVFVLVDPRVEEYPAYVVNLVRQGRSILVGVPVLRSREGDFTLELPAAAIRPGSCRLELFGVGDGGRTGLAEYRFEVSRPAF